MNKFWHIYTAAYYKAIKINESQLHVRTWMNLNKLNTEC